MAGQKRPAASSDVGEVRPFNIKHDVYVDDHRKHGYCLIILKDARQFIHCPHCQCAITFNEWPIHANGSVHKERARARRELWRLIKHETKSRVSKLWRLIKRLADAPPNKRRGALETCFEAGAA